MKTLLVIALTVAFYMMLGLVPLLSSTALVVVPASKLGAMVGWASLGALTYKGIASACVLGYLSKRVA